VGCLTTKPLHLPLSPHSFLNFFQCFSPFCLTFLLISCPFCPYSLPGHFLYFHVQNPVSDFLFIHSWNVPIPPYSTIC
jgi:hypothetical protein